MPAPLTFTTKADAARWLAAAEADTLRGTFAPRTTDRLSVAEWLERWHEEHSLHKRPGTLARDRSAILRHIVPRLGHRQLDSLSPADLQRFVAAVAGEVGPGTTHAAHAVLRAALRTAADVYGHLFSETNDAVMARVDEAFGSLHPASDSRGRPS